MDRPESFIVALYRTTKRNDETLADFRAEYGRLTTDDKAWFKSQMTAEFGWTYA